jgi:hypothetical protein
MQKIIEVRFESDNLLKEEEKLSHIRYLSRILSGLQEDINSNKGSVVNVFLYLNVLIRRWVEEKFRLRSQKAVLVKYQSIVQSNSGLFIHWQKGVTY